MNNKMQKHSLVPEMKLLLLCAKRNQSAKERLLTEECIRGPIDWNIFFTLAMKNRIYPVIFQNLKQADNGSIDAKVLRKLEEKCKGNQLKALRLTRELMKVTGLLEQHSIRALSVKGPYLALSLYHDVSLRVSKDLDILVSSSDLEQIDRLLKEAGYQEEEATRHLSRRQREHYIKKYYHISYSSQNGIQLELHWRLMNSNYSITFEEAWRNKQEADLFGSRLLVLRDEENMLYLIQHGSKHAWKRLRWLCDIYEFIQNRELDWDYIRERSKALGTLYQLKQTELLLKELLQAVLPIELELSNLDQITAERLAEMALPFITAMDENPEAPGHSLFGYYVDYMYLWQKSFGKKFRYVLSFIAPKVGDFHKYKISDRLFFLYYFCRPIRLLNKYLKPKIFRRSKNDRKET